MSSKLSLTILEQTELLTVIKKRFDKSKKWDIDLNWNDIEQKLVAQPAKLWSINEMERTGGEPAVVGMDSSTGEYLVMDCSVESPKGRRSLCYDRKALESRKEYKPANSAMDMAQEMGIELLTADDYRKLQELGPFDTKTSSWLQTPANIRKLGGAIFGDYRFDTVFVYHNGAESYYAARGFRGVLRV